MNGNEILRQRLIELAAALALLTRLPVRFLALPRLTVASQAVWAYPVVGAIIGIIGGAAYWLVYSLSVPPALAAICALLAMILSTGALHEDGLADFADGLGGDSKERSLSIMRDHQIGTYGIIALVLSLAVRATAIALIAEPHLVTAALIGAGAASRLSAVLIMAAMPPARKDGLSASVGSPTAGLAGVTLLLTLVIAWLALPFFVSLLLIVSAIVSAVVIGSVAQSRLGGQTVDTCRTQLYWSPEWPYWSPKWRSSGPPSAMTTVMVPLWLLVLPAAAIAAIAHRRIRAAATIGHCKACNYDRSGIPSTAPCPECGHSAPKAGAPKS